MKRWTTIKKPRLLRFSNKSEIIQYVEEELDLAWGLTSDTSQDQPSSAINYFSIGGRWHLHLKQKTLNPIVLDAYYDTIKTSPSFLDKEFKRYFPGKKYKDYFEVLRPFSYYRPRSKALHDDVKIITKRLWVSVFLPLRKDWEGANYPSILLVDEIGKGKLNRFDRNEERVMSLKAEDIIGKYWGVVVDYHY